MAKTETTTVQDILGCRRAAVFLDDKEVGFLEQVATDLYRFAYLDEYARENSLPLSWSLPLKTKRFETEALHPFFDNLLFEGSQLRAAERTYGLSRESNADRFKLLLLSAQDTIGGAKIIPIDAQGRRLVLPTNDKSLPDWQPVPLSDAYEDRCAVCLESGPTHKACYKNLWGQKSRIALCTDPQDPRAVFRYVVPGASISGAQRKNVLQLSKSGTLLPRQPFTHIVKPEGDYEEMPANEHLTMCLARRAGFPVPPCGLYQAQGLGFLFLIKRFDRELRSRRYYMEDFAQILGEMAEDKENASLEKLAAAITDVATSPIIENLELFRRVAFNFMVGNGDMHLKNWSLVYDLKTKVYRLSAAYDWLNVRASMPQEQVESILPLNGKRSGLTRSDFVTFGEAIGLSKKLIMKVLTEVEKWRADAHELCPKSALSKPRQARYLAIVEERSARLR